MKIQIKKKYLGYLYPIDKTKLILSRRSNMLSAVNVVYQRENQKSTYSSQP